MSSTYPMQQNQPGGHQGPYNPYPQVTQPASHTNTTVIIQQPAAAVGVRHWSTGICECCSDMEVCLCGIFCGCCLAMRVSADMDETMCLPWCVPHFLMALRVKMRTQERIQGTICNDCLIQTCCGPCTLCQLAREVKMIKQRRQI